MTLTRANQPVCLLVCGDGQMKRASERECVHVSVCEDMVIGPWTSTKSLALPTSQRCKPHVYDKRMAFTNPGGDHVHIVRNEGAIKARTVAVQFIPVGSGRLIQVPDPGN